MTDVDDMVQAQSDLDAKMAWGESSIDRVMALVLPVLSTAQDRVVVVEDSVATLHGGGVQSRVSLLEDRATDLEARVTATETRLTALEARVTALEP